MKRREWSWYSPHLNREMPLCSWGHFGKPVVLFPTAGGDYLECERFLMIRVLTPLIEAGRIKVYAPGNINREAWMNGDEKPWHKSWLQSRYDLYLTNELLPFISEDCAGARGFCSAGASLGAYNAVNAAAKHPFWFDRCIAMSGTYDFDRWMGGHRDDNYYFNMPMYFLPNLGESEQLTALRRSFFILATGQGRAEAPDETRRLAGIMGSKAIPVHMEIWGHDAHHDWPTWRTMLPMFLDRVT